MNYKDRSKRKGQAIVWVTLITLVVLTIGLSIASRTLSNIRQSQETEQTNRAFSAAEAGIEAALYLFESPAGVPVSQITPTPLPASNSEYSYTVSEEGDGNETVLPVPLEKDGVYQVNATNMVGNITIYWVKSGDAAEENSRASLLVTLVSREADDDYDVVRVAYNPTTGLTRVNGFSPSAGGEEVQVGGVRFLEKTDEITLPGTGGKEKIIRIRVMDNGESGNTIGLKADAGQAFPVQYYTITSTGTSGDTERTIRVNRTDQMLPGLFDFALMSLSGDGLKKD